jgi:ribonucleoside-diphosphate reductase alpha chain
MRVVNTLHQWVLEDGLFRTTAKAQVLRNEVAHILLKRMGSFNSPIYYNLGIEEKPLVSACFINSVDDSMESITDLGKTEARIFQRGAGAGCNWSKLRSSHEKVRGMGNSSGPVSFMVATDMMASKIKSGGRKRRAARMDILNVDHPDIMEFVRDKANTEELARKLVEQGWSTKMEDPRSIHNMLPHQSTNLSVRIFDRFMEAALAGKEWPLTYRSKSGVHEVLDARTLLHQIAQATWECGDPGIQFHDTINGWSTLQDIETINGSNPCGEYVGVDDSSCNLASINVLPPDRGPLTHDELRHITKVFITCMDSIAGHAGYPTEKIGQNAVAYRALGLGWTNLGALAMNNGYPYDSHEARRMAAEIASVTTATAYEQSIELAKRTKPFHRAEECHVGICTVFNKHYRAALQAFGPENAVVEQWKALVKQVEDRNYPRNSAVSLCAPCGTIGFLMDNETTGCEPGIALKAIKKLSYGGEMTLVLRTVEPALQRLGYTKDQIAAVLEQVEGDGHVEGMVKKEHLAIFDTAIPTGPTERAISAMGHLKMLEAIQPHLSMAMSKTVNLPNTATVDEIEDTIIQSWKMGIKCLSIFRDGCKAFQPIAPTKDKATEAIKALTWGDRKRLPNTRNSVTTKIDMSGTELYMTVGLFDDGTPGELFFVAGKHGATLAGLLDSFAIAVSHALQYGCSISALADKFKGIRFAPEGWSDGHHYKSIIDYVAHWLDNRYCKTEEEVEGGNGHGKVHAGSIAEALRSPLLVDLSNREVCARCGEFMYQAGGSNCHVCHGCGSVSGGCG